MERIQKITTYIHKQHRFIAILLFVVITFTLNTSFAFAQSEEVDNWMVNIGLSIGGFFAGLGGMLFDKSINALVLQMGDIFLNQGLGTVVNSIWTVIRDLFNIVFIFTLVYIGLRTIWDADDSRTKKLLGGLIAAALLINFSLYIAKVVVDISNYTAVTIYSIATSGITGNFGIKGDYYSYISGNNSISGAFMQVLNVPSWFAEKSDSPFLYGVMVLLFLMFLGFVLAYGALMITARFIAIIFYLIFSPFMFLGWVLPHFQSYATKWWKGFIGYSFFAPVYIFMLYVGLYALQQIKEGLGGDSATFAAALADGKKGPETFSIFLLFIIGTGFLLAATKVAGAMSQGGAAIGMGAAHKLSGKIAGVATFGIPARAGRMSLGWGAHKISSSDRIQDYASGLKGNVLTQKLALSTQIAADHVADSSFDVRNVGSVGTHLSTGKGKKGGYNTYKKEKVNKEKKRAKTYSYSNKELKKVAKEEDKKIEAAQTEVEARELRLKNNTRIKDNNRKIKRLSDEIASGTLPLKEKEGKLLELQHLRAEIQEETEKINIEEAQALLKQARENKKTAIKEVKESRKRSYARTLDETILNIIPMIRDANKEAAKVILDELDKTKEEKLIEKLDAVTKKTDKDKTETK